MIKTIFPIKMLHELHNINEEESSTLNSVCQAIFRNHLAMAGLSYQDGGDDGVHIPLFTDDNIKNYNEIKNLHDFFAKSFLKLANEYDESITHTEILERMEQTTGRLPFMRNGDYKGLHCHSGASMVAVYYLDCVDKDYSEKIMLAYWNRYCTEKRLGRKPTDEDRARIHNGGPNGYKKSSTVKYWQSVKSNIT